MVNEFQTLLQATIHHLEDLSREGTKYLTMDPALLSALTQKAGAKPKAPVASRPPINRMEFGFQKKPESSEPSAVASSTPSIEIQEPPLIPTGGPALIGEAKVAAFFEIRERAMQCVKCPHLSSTRKNVVFGAGDINSTLLFVGEAPSADEDIAGEPFVGRAGELLTKIIQAMGRSRETVYIANILKCRPDTINQTFGNRKPTPAEIRNCLPYLRAQIELIRPKVLVALGGTAMEGLFGKMDDGITKLRGRWREFQGIPVMPTYHPSYLLRNQLVSVKREVWEDMLQVLERLGEPISEKQRNFFR